MSALESGSGRTKTPSIFTASGSMESQEKAKKYKTMPRSSCPPLKVLIQFSTYTYISIDQVKINLAYIYIYIYTNF